MSRYSARQALSLALSGDVSSIPLLDTSTDEDLKDSSGAGDLTLGRSAVIRVLSALADGSVTDESVQRWAAFMRWGVVSATRRTDLDIEWEPAFDLAIAEALGRMDELGDVVDGTMDLDEINQLIKALSPSTQ